jgi:hypothetical protein
MLERFIMVEKYICFEKVLCRLHTLGVVNVYSDGVVNNGSTRVAWCVLKTKKPSSQKNAMAINDRYGHQRPCFSRKRSGRA